MGDPALFLPAPILLRVTLRYEYHDDTRYETIKRRFEAYVPAECISSEFGMWYIAEEKVAAVLRQLREGLSHPGIKLTSRFLNRSRGVLQLSCYVEASISDMRKLKLETLRKELDD